MRAMFGVNGVHRVFTSRSPKFPVRGQVADHDGLLFRRQPGDGVGNFRRAEAGFEQQRQAPHRAVALQLRLRKDPNVTRRLRPSFQKPPLRFGAEPFGAGVRIENDPSRQRELLRPVARDEAVAGEREQRRFAADLPERAFARLQGLAVQQMDPRRDVRAAEMHARQRAVLERTRRSGFRSAQPPGFFQQHVENFSRRTQFGESNHIAAPHGCRVQVRQVQRCARARATGLDIMIVILQAANARGPAGRLKDDRLTATQRSAGQRSRDYGANTAQREHAIHRQARFADFARQRCR